MALLSLAKKLQNKEISSEKLTEAYLERIEKFDPVLNAFVTVTTERAKEDAKKADKNKAGNTISGIPMILKDNIAVKDIRMTASSKILDDYISPYDATVTTRLQGSVLLGKGNLDAFAFGASTENSGYFVTKNPWDKTRVAGGSSGGVAAAVAADLAMFGIGTDTGGSIRQPAGFCGVVGLKPTYGRSSRYGLAAMGSSLDCPGPIAKSVEDAALILEYIAGYDEHDATSMHLPSQKFSQFGDIKGKKIGLPKEFFDEQYVEGLDKGVKEQVLHSVRLLEKMGATVVEVSIPHAVYALPVYYIITPSEIAANMSRYDGIRYGHSATNPKDIMELYFEARSVFEEEVKRRIFVGNYSLSSGYYDAYYNKAMQVRTLILQEMSRVFASVDVIVSPTSPTPAFQIGENADDPVAMYLADIFTVTANIAGIPSISIPCGLSESLPVGFQIMGKQFDEQSILDVAYRLEQEIKFEEMYKPNLEKLLS